MRRIFFAFVAIAAGCGAGTAGSAPFGSPLADVADPLVAEVSDCSGSEAAVDDCVVQRLCAYPFEEERPRRFHLKPVGVTPWIQVELAAGGEVSSIDLARTWEGPAQYVVGLTCPSRPVALPNDAPTDVADDGSPTEEDLPVVPAAEQSHRAARAAFAAAEDGLRVAAYALWLARSEDPTDHAVLREALTARAVVELLGNTTFDRGPRRRQEPPGHRWPLPHILFTLRDGATPSGHALLEALAGDPLWSDHDLDMPDSHVDWLLLSLSENRPPSAVVLRYWRAHARPDDGYVNVTATALVDNGSDEALALLVSLLRDSRFGDARFSWIRRDIAARRNDAAVLAVAERLSSETRLPAAVRRRLFADLFGDWTDELRPDTGLSCPDLGRIPAEAAAVLRRIAEVALGRGVGASTRAVIDQGLEKLTAGE